jgi:hypothetical protein
VSLDSVLSKLAALGTFPEKVAGACTPLVKRAAVETAKSGRTPWGEPWAPRKKDGKPALVNAASAIEVRAVGSLVRIVLVGISTGSAKVQAIQHWRRQVIPRHTTSKGRGGQGLPPQISKALHDGATKLFEQLAGHA